LAPAKLPGVCTVDGADSWESPAAQTPNPTHSSPGGSAGGQPTLQESAPCYGADSARLARALLAADLGDDVNAPAGMVPADVG